MKDAIRRQLASSSLITTENKVELRKVRHIVEVMAELNCPPDVELVHVAQAADRRPRVGGLRDG
jgi:hypothetical protein